MIEKLLEDLKRDEGFVRHAYQDHLGFLTIGYGCLIDEKKGGGIPDEIAERWLRHNVEVSWKEFTRRQPWVLDEDDDVQRALANMVYQLGVQGVCNFRLMLEALEDGDRVEAADEALDSRWAEQTPKRAWRVANLIRGYDEDDEPPE
jgi:lysozyme